MATNAYEDLYGNAPEGAARKRSVKRLLIWLSVFFTGFAGEAWCVLEQVLTVPLTSDPTTVEKFAPLQTAEHWYLVGAAAFGVLIVVALIRLLLLWTKSDPGAR